MINFRQQVLGPYTAHDFRRYLLRTMGIHLGLNILVCGILYFLQPRMYETDSYIIVGLFSLGIYWFSSFICHPVLIQARFAEIFPGHELSKFSYLIIAFIPAAFYGFMGLLYFRRQPVSLRFNFLRPLVLAPVMILVFCFQIYSPSFSYLSGMASVQYLSSAQDDARSLLAFKDAHDYVPNFYAKYLDENPGKIRLTQNVLLVALSASYISKGQKRSIASGISKSEADWAAGNELIETTLQAIDENLSRRISLMEYGPLSLVQIGSPLEILILEMIDNKLRYEFNAKLIEETQIFISDFEKEMNANGFDKEGKEARRIKAYRTKLEEFQKQII
jgi:hypothetical protein